MPASPTDGICHLTQEDGPGLFQLEDGSGALILEFCDEVAEVTGGTVGWAGSVGRRHDYTERELKQQRQFSRRLWEELLEAQEEAEARAIELRRENKRKQAQQLEQAAQAAQQAREQAEKQAQFHDTAMVTTLTAALHSASLLEATNRTITEAQTRARAFQAHIAEIEDEEDAITLLLLS